MEITATTSVSWYRAEGKSGNQSTSEGTPTQGDIERPRQEPEDEQRTLAQLKARDSEVRAHEQAHLAAAGGLVRGGMAFTYQRGPDGRLYAVGGEVGIDTSPVVGDPHATSLKAEQIKRAALAPAQPSGQDRAVAAQAAQMAAAARLELSRQTQGESAASGSRLDVYA